MQVYASLEVQTCINRPAMGDQMDLQDARIKGLVPKEAVLLRRWGS